MALFDRLNRLASTVGELINDDARARIDLAEGLLARGDADAALHVLRQVLDKRQDSARALHLLALCHIARQDHDAALAALQQALAVNDEAADVHETLGELRERRGEDEEAVVSYRGALQRATAADQRVRLWRRLGRLHLRQGRLDKAVRELRKAVAQDPEDAEAQGLLGQALVQSARRKGELGVGPTHQAARLALSRAARAEHPEPQTLAALGVLLLSTGQPADAEQALQRALEVNADEALAVVGLGQLRLDQGDAAAALGLARRAVALLSPDDGLETAVLRGEALLLLGQCHARVGDYESALRAYERILAGRAPQDERRRGVAREALRLALRGQLFREAAALACRADVGDLAATPEGLAAQAQALLASDAAAAAALLQPVLAAPEGAEGPELLEPLLVQARLLAQRGDAGGAAAALWRAAQIAGSPARDPRPFDDLRALYQRERAALPLELYGLLTAAHRHLSRCLELSELSTETAALLATLDRPLLVTVMGEFNSGKSTFVNALLGEEIAPMGITPTTATINILKYGRSRGGRVVYRDDSSREIAWEDVPAVLRAVDEDEARRIRVVEVLYPLEVLQQVNVVDTPGLNSILPEHEQTAREFIAQADAVVWLFTVDQAGKASEAEALATIHAEGRRILGVLNKIDRLGPDTPELQQILDHLNAPESGLVEVLETIVPFSGREALLGRRAGPDSEERLQRANLPMLMRTLEERFFARSKSLKAVAVRARLLALLRRARAAAERLVPAAQPERLAQALRLAQADAVLFQRDFLPAERRRLIGAADEVHGLAARETVDFVRPRRWPFGENQASPADRDFLVGLLEERLSVLVQASRARVVAELRLGAANEDTLRLLDEQVCGRYLAFARGYLRGGKVDDFFVRVLPRLELSEAAVQRALEKDAPTALDMLEEELLGPLARFAERHFQQKQAALQRLLDQEELTRFDLEQRVVLPLDALIALLESIGGDE